MSEPTANEGDNAKPDKPKAPTQVTVRYDGPSGSLVIPGVGAVAKGATIKVPAKLAQSLTDRKINITTIPEEGDNE